MSKKFNFNEVYDNMKEIDSWDTLTDEQKCNLISKYYKRERVLSAIISLMAHNRYEKNGAIRENIIPFKFRGCNKKRRGGNIVYSYVGESDPSPYMNEATYLLSIHKKINEHIKQDAQKTSL